MNKPTTSDTPRTDAAKIHANSINTVKLPPSEFVVTADFACELEIELNHSRAEIAILKETHENQMDIIEKLHECRDVRRFEAIQMEIDGYLDGAPDASAASKLAGRISAILKPMDAAAEPSNALLDGDWIPMKQWRYEEAAKDGVSESVIAMRLSRGKYPNLKIKHINKRVVFVSPPNDALCNVPTQTEKL